MAEWRIPIEHLLVFAGEKEAQYYLSPERTEAERVEIRAELQEVCESISGPTDAELRTFMRERDWTETQHNPSARDLAKARWRSFRKTAARAELQRQKSENRPDTIHLKLDSGIIEPSRGPSPQDLAADSEYPVTSGVREKIEREGSWGTDWPARPKESATPTGNDAPSPERKTTERGISATNTTRRKRRKRAKKGQTQEELPPRWLNRFAVFRWLCRHPKWSSGGGVVVALLIAKQAIDYQINGATKTAAFVFFLAWGAFALGVYISSWWDRRRPLMMLAMIICAVIFFVAWVAYLPLPPTNQVEKQANERLAPLITTFPTPTPDDLRSELQADGNRVIRTITTRITLKRKYSLEEIGHFRVMYELATTTNKITPEFYLAWQDYYAKNAYATDPNMKTFGFRTAIRYREPNDTYKAPPSFRIGPRHYGASIGLTKDTDKFEFTWNVHNQIPSYETLEDINGKELYIFVTDSLVDKISEVSFQVNNWELFSIKTERLVFPDDVPIAPWFLPLSREEKAIPWKSVNVRFDEPLPPDIAARFKGQNPGWAWSLDFGLLHPRKIPEPELKVDPFKPN